MFIIKYCSAKCSLKISIKLLAGTTTRAILFLIPVCESEPLKIHFVYQFSLKSFGKHNVIFIGCSFFVRVTPLSRFICSPPYVLSLVAAGREV